PGPVPIRCSRPRFIAVHTAHIREEICVWSKNAPSPFLPSLLILLSRLRIGLTLGSHVDNIWGQQGSYRLKKLLRLNQRDIGFRVTDMSRSAVISDTSQVG